MPSTVLMTATVTPPPGMPGTLRADPHLRRREYLAAFNFYLNLPDEVVDHIVILENSADDLSAFEDLSEMVQHNKRISLVRCPSDYPADKGKGYGEFLMMDFGIAHLLRGGNIRANDSIWKVTGRIRVKNLHRVIMSASRQADLTCDLRNIPFIGDRFGGNQWMELRLFGFTPRIYAELFQGTYNSGFVLEKAYYSLVETLYTTTASRIQPRFALQPIYEGVSGFSNRSYTSPSYKMKNVLRAITRKIIPKLWL